MNEKRSYRLGKILVSKTAREIGCYMFKLPCNQQASFFSYLIPSFFPEFPQELFQNGPNPGLHMKQGHAVTLNE